jgi:hypothetical protein
MAILLIFVDMEVMTVVIMFLVFYFYADSKFINNSLSPLLLSASELCRPSDRRFLAK